MKGPFYSHGFRFMLQATPPKKKLPNKLLLSGGTKQTEKEGTFQTPPAASLTLRDSGNTNAGHFGECVCSVAQPQIPALHRVLRPCRDQTLHGAMADLSQNC